eukprot:1102776-Rhodomonas_salina.3
MDDGERGREGEGAGCKGAGGRGDWWMERIEGQGVCCSVWPGGFTYLSLIHISEPTRPRLI